MITGDPAQIERLSQNLRRLRTGGDPGEEIVRWLRSMCAMAASIPRPQTQKRRGYTRTLLHRSDRFEVLALHWAPGVVTPIHDHGGANCWLAVAKGSVGVENFVRRDDGSAPGIACVEFEGREELAVTSIDYRQDDVHLHRCFTAGEPAVSLHVYAHPIDRFLTFDERTQTCQPATSTYDATLNV